MKPTGYEISWHPGHRPTHTLGGRQYTFKEMETLGVNDMLNDYNCYHWKIPVIVGVTPLTITAEELERLEALELKKHEWNGKEYTLYELMQLQNRYNRDLRKTFNALDAWSIIGDEDREDELSWRLDNQITRHVDMFRLIETTQARSTGSQPNNSVNDGLISVLNTLGVGGDSERTYFVVDRIEENFPFGGKFAVIENSDGYGTFDVHLSSFLNPQNVKEGDSIYFDSITQKYIVDEAGTAQIRAEIEERFWKLFKRDVPEPSVPPAETEVPEFIVPESDEEKNIGDLFQYNWNGEHVTIGFLKKVVEVSYALGISPDDLMAVMAWESWLNPAQTHLGGGSAVGLIQFTPISINELNRRNPGLDLTRNDLLNMSAVEQMEYVYLHLKPKSGQMKTLSDVYMAVLWPIAVGQPDDYVLWFKDSETTGGYYKANEGLDINNDGQITKAEATQRVIERRDFYGKK